ncbi:MAG: hypothetical protein LC802_11395, partial [Acidobacteria bacterium]|nr:hypothetical protein [Acidobacteriota bacterium]
MAATKKKAAKKAAPSKKVKTTARSKPVAAKKPTKKKPAKKKSVAAKKPAAAKKLAAAKRPAAAAATARKRPAADKSETAPQRGTASKKAARRDVLDFDAFPPGAVTRSARLLCLACIFDLFTGQLGVAPRTASNEIKRYAPSVEELTAKDPQRPFFRDLGERNPRCPYCDAARRWHARIETFRIEGGKATDAARRALVKRLPTRDEQFQIQEVKSNSRAVFFEWLDALGHELDFEDDRAWMLAAARAYLERREPKTEWGENFEGVRQVRRSRRVEEGFERDGARLYLAPALYNDVLLVQYLVSRSHRHGGRT